MYAAETNVCFTQETTALSLKKLFDFTVLFEADNASGVHVSREQRAGKSSTEIDSPAKPLHSNFMRAGKP